MKKNNTLMLGSALAVVSALLLAGCTELPGKKNMNSTEQSAEQITQGIGNAVKKELGKAATGIEQALEKTATSVIDEIKADSISKELSVSQEVGSSSVLHIENAVGEVEVKSITGDSINVKTTIWAHNSSNHQDDRQNILDDAEVSVQVKGDQLHISTHAKNNPKKDLWTWAEDKYGFSELSISYVIEVPERIEMYQITNNVGKIQLRNLQGTYQIISNVGNINIEGAKITGDSTLESDTGSISLDIASIDSGSSLKAKTDVGSISAVLADDLRYTLKTQSELGQINGVSDGRTEINGGGPLISLKSQIGTITVQN